MTLYEVYVRKVDAYNGWPKGEERLKLFIHKGNAIKYKKWWEKRWEYLSKHPKEPTEIGDPDTWTTRPPLILQVVETED